MSSGTATTITARIITEECLLRGISERKLFKNTGLSAALIHSQRTVTVDDMYALWDRALMLTGNPSLAIDIAAAVPFGAYRLMDYLFATSSSTLGALERGARFFNLFNSAFLLRLRTDWNSVYLELHNPSDAQTLERVYIEYIFANYFVRARLMNRVRLVPTEIHVTYARPINVDSYDRLFQAPFRFGRTANRIILPRDVLNLPNYHGDAELCEMLEAYALQKQRQVSNDDGHLAQIRSLIKNSLKSGKLTLESISRQLAKSSRSLQRDIHAHGTSFQELLDNVKLSEAISLLADLEMPLSQIAARLHFSDSSSFTRAFHRWTGRTPQQHRLQTQQQPR